MDVSVYFSDADMGDTLTYTAMSDMDDVRHRMDVPGVAAGSHMGMVTITGVCGNHGTATVSHGLTAYRTGRDVRCGRVGLTLSCKTLKYTATSWCTQPDIPADSRLTSVGWTPTLGDASGLMAIPNADGSIALEWTPAPNATHNFVYGTDGTTSGCLGLCHG